MTVNVEWSLTLGGNAITADTNLGSTLHHGHYTVSGVYWLRHDGENSITNCKIYMKPVSEDDYVGNFSPREDLDELLSWGDATVAGDFGGLMINLDNTGGAGTWPTLADKGTTTYAVFRTGVGDTKDNGITLPIEVGLNVEGEIPPGLNNNVAVLVRLQIPNNESVVGIRHVDIGLSYDYTD